MNQIMYLEAFNKGH